MSLPVPIVGVDPGPDYAQNVNNCFFFIDSHDHSPGKGVKITPAGIDITQALTFANNAATNLSYLNFNSQGAVTTLKSLYVVNNDLYFTDGNGNAFPLTASGGVAGTPGSIGSLTAPASVTYNSGQSTFYFKSTSVAPANLDISSITLRNIASPFYGATVSAPLALAADYNIVLPPIPTGSPPAPGSFVVMDTSGNMTAPWRPDYSTINVSGGLLYANLANAEHAWELNGNYGTLAYPQTNIDSVFFAQTGIVIQSIFIYTGSTGASGTTEYDIKYKATPSSAWTSILSTTGKISATTALANGSIVTTGASSPYTVTVTLTGHGFVAGDSITIADATPAAYNGTWTVATASANSFTFAITTTQGSNTGGTIATRSQVYTDSGTVIGSQAGVVKPVINLATIPAGSVMRWDLLQSMVAGATDARIRIYYLKS